MAGQTIAMQRPNALATYLAKKGNAEPTAPQMSVLSSSVTQSLADMAEMAKARMAGQALREVIGDDKPDPTKEIQTVMSIAKDMAAIDESRSRATREELKAERDMRREMQERLHATSTQSEGSMVQMLMAMMQMQRDSDQRWQERLERLEKDHREELRRLKDDPQSKKESSDGGFLKDLTQQLLLDRLNSAPPSPLEEFERAKKLVGLVTPTPAASGSDPNLARLQYELAVRQMDKEAEIKREEMQARLQIEERKAKNSERIVGALGPLFAMLSGNKLPGAPQGQSASAPAATGTGGLPQETHRYACTNQDCGKEFLHPSATAKGACPECGSELMYVGREA